MQYLDKNILNKKDSYSFDSTRNLLKIYRGSLEVVPNRLYEILVSTVIFNTEYTQKIRINIIDDIVPIVLLK